MSPSEDEDTAELSNGVSLMDALQMDELLVELENGMTALWRGLKAVKATLPAENTARSMGAAPED